MRLGWVWVPVVATGLLVVLGGASLVDRARLPLRERLARFVAEQKLRDAAAVTVREALWGETVDGNGWEHYVAACEELKPLALVWSRRSETDPEELYSRGRPLCELREETVATIDAAMRLLQRGARSARLHRNGELLRGHLDNVAATEVSRGFATGDIRAGCESFVDSCVLHADKLQILGVGGSFPPFRDEWLIQIDSSTGALLAHALEQLDARLQSFGSPERVIADGVATYLPLHPLQQSFSQAMGAWRYGFDAWWRELVLLDRLVQHLPEVSPTAMDWQRRQQQIAAFTAGLEDDRESWTAHWVPMRVRSFEKWNRVNLTQLRLLRLALAFTQGHELPRLDDPLGSGPLQVEIRGDEATFRGAGGPPERPLTRTARRRG